MALAILAFAAEYSFVLILRVGSDAVQKLYNNLLGVISMCTLSEELFERYCTLHGYSFNRIKIVLGGGRFPDYEVQTPRGAVICEVKEIVPNKDDKAFDEMLKNYGQADACRATGKRARAALVAACKQLGRFREDPRPCIAVIFDTTYAHYFQPDDIGAAMFGDPTVLFPVDRITHGLNRRLNDKQGLYLGAVAVLLRAEPEGAVRLDIYHNPFTSKPICPAYFPDPQDRHFIKKGHPDESGYGWHEYVEPQSDA